MVSLLKRKRRTCTVALRALSEPNSIFKRTVQRFCRSRTRSRLMSSALLNVVQLGIGFFLLLVQINSRGYIQETFFEDLSEKEDVNAHAGYYGLAIFYLVFTFSSLVTTPIIERVTLQWAMAFGVLLNFLCEIGFLRVNETYYFVSSGVAGFGAALCWPALGTYMTRNSTEKTLERNSSVVWAFSQASLLVGGGVMLYIFTTTKQNGDELTEATRRWICIAFIVALLLSFITFSTLPAAKRKESSYEGEEKVTLKQELVSTVQLMKTSNMKQLAIVFFYSGLAQSFWNSIFPTCISFTEQLGPSNMKIVALSAICSGMGQLSVCCTIAVLGRRIPRRFIVFFGCILELFVFVSIYLHFPADSSINPTNELSVFEPSALVALILAFFLGFGDGCWNIEIYAIIGDIYPHCSNEAYALFNFYQSAATSASLFLSSSIPLTGHIVLLMSTAVVAAFCFNRVDRKEIELPNKSAIATETTWANASENPAYQSTSTISA